MTVKPYCLAVTSYNKNQPGFLDFSYRLKSLAIFFDLEIILVDGQREQDAEIKGARHHYIEMGEGKLGWSTYLHNCFKYIKHKQPDVVVLLHSALSPLSIFLRGTPVCLYWNEHPTNLMHLSQHFSPIKNLITKLLHRFFFVGVKHADLVMPIGEAHYDDLVSHGVDRKKIELMYMGVSEEFVNNSNEKTVDSRFIKLIYVGSVSKARGRDVMLDAMSIVRKKTNDVELKIIGASDEQVAYCKDKIQSLGISDTVTVIKRIGGAEVPAYMHQADVGICLWEVSPWTQFNPPTKLFEYLVAGLPVLASDIRTHTQYVEPWGNGFIFQYDAKSLANAIIEIHGNKRKINSLKHQAELSGEVYKWSGIEPKFINAIKRLIES